MFKEKSFWLIGASEGLGEALARQLDAAGARLILSSRSADRLKALSDELRSAQPLAMDVSDPASVKKACEYCADCDGIIYCAGFYEPVEAQKWDPVAVERMIDVNFTGAARVLGQLLPGFFRRNHGHVVLIGSLSGHRGLPGAVGYGASKAALMHLAENIKSDLDDSDVTVQIINPGFIRTRLTEKNDFKMPQLMSPEHAAQHVIRAMRSARFETNFPHPFAWLFTVGKHLPFSWFRRIFD